MVKAMQNNSFELVKDFFEEKAFDPNTFIEFGYDDNRSDFRVDFNFSSPCRGSKARIPFSFLAIRNIFNQQELDPFYGIKNPHTGVIHNPMVKKPVAKPSRSSICASATSTTSTRPWQAAATLSQTSHATATAAVVIVFLPSDLSNARALTRLRSLCS